MAEHFKVGEKGFVEKLNALVDEVNALAEEQTKHAAEDGERFEKVEAELANKQNKRGTKTGTEE